MDMNQQLRFLFEGMDYEYLIAYAELVLGFEDPSDMKHEDLIDAMVEKWHA